MGVEPTRDSDYCPADGFEDREAHRDPSASRRSATSLAQAGQEPVSILAYSTGFAQPFSVSLPRVLRSGVTVALVAIVVDARDML